jgi:hypothetical protein
MAIDVERLLAEALSKHGIRLDPHDPAIVLVTLNRMCWKMQLSALRPTYVRPRASTKTRLTGCKGG